MNEPPLRDSLEAWEAESAAVWDSIVRSPAFLRRTGQQIALSLESQQRVKHSLEQAGLIHADGQRSASRLIYLLERLEKQVESLALRLDDLEARIDHG